MKKEIIFISILICLIICGCGHNITNNTKGIGLDISWQSNNYIPNIRLGYWDAASALLRGNAHYNSNTSNGASFTATGGISQTIQLDTCTQLNEGYLKEVLNNQNTSDQTKYFIIQHLTKYPKIIQPTSSKTIGSASTIGSNPTIINPETTGTDKIIQKISDAYQNSVNAFNNVVDVSGITVSKIFKYVIIAFAIFFIILLILIYKYLKAKKQLKEKQKKYI